MKLVFVHGRAQEGKNKNELRDRWEGALRIAWTKCGISAPANIDLRFPYYGDELDKWVKNPDGTVKKRSVEVQPDLTPFEEAFLRGMIEKAGVTDAEIRAELPTDVATRAPQNWEWLQAGFRALSRRSPALGRFGLGLLADVETYLTRGAAKRAVDDIVRREISGSEQVVVVAHSLGTIVSYRVLNELNPPADVPLFMTLGSPLGIDIVKTHLRPPSLAIPKGVRKWVNAADERDPVALFSKLTSATFCDGIENLSEVKNSREDPHSIYDYLSDSVICKRLSQALA
jgi:hypothetical protein